MIETDIHYAALILWRQKPDLSTKELVSRANVYLGAPLCCEDLKAIEGQLTHSIDVITYREAP